MADALLFGNARKRSVTHSGGIFQPLISHPNAMGRSSRKTPEEKQLGSLLKRLDGLVSALEAMGLDEYLARRNDRKRMLLSNLALGVAKGLGMAVGFTILGAVLFMLLKRVATANLPIIGEFIAQIVDIVEKKG